MKSASILITLLSAFFLVEPGVVSAQPSTEAPSSAATELKILSWNLWMLPPFIKRTKKRIRAKKIGDALKDSDYDLLVFQESFHPGARRKIKRRIKATFPYKIGPANRNPISIITNSGITIYSKMPIKKTGSIRFKLRSGINRMSRKGALMVHGEKNGQKFQILGTHLNAGGPEYVRISQVGQIRNELLDVHYQEGVPQIICGDFNIHKHKEHRYELMMNFLDAEDGPLSGDIQFTSGIKNDRVFIRSEPGGRFSFRG